ncbi:aromatase/cyclase [Frankia sp. QA3]|uniref:aromatase/cyclase n=1 Tax=Frankia sp. QA3 TaxID=710111 RepID=UPI000269C651|nr:aromatase/cyclase [Frankia sp. QA3]EIV93554.1 oligoketide cyclase/lipid transport protein [Frankia sp. QA3]
MSTLTRRMEHSRVVEAPADRLYALVADVSRWPVILGPCIHARQLEMVGDNERIEIWAHTNGEVKSWTSRRLLDSSGLRIAFQQERSAAPIAAMSGEWSFLPAGDGRTRIVLAHSFSAVAQEPAALDWIAEAVDRNSIQELAALGEVAALGHPPDQFVFGFSDRIELPRVALGEAYDFIYRSDLWPERLPHVLRVSLHEQPGSVQEMEMETITSDGSAHTTSSVRLCFPLRQIAYKQTVLPALLSGHSGIWEFEQVDADVAITSRHMVAVAPAAVERVLGPGTTLDQAGAYVRDALGANSRATMEAAGRFASSAVHRA